MTGITRTTGIVSLAVLVVVTLFGLELARELRGPNAASGYRQIFGEYPPEHIHDLRIKYYSHLKGSGLYLGFRTLPQHLESILGFDPLSAQLLYSDDFDGLEPWQHVKTFQELFADDFPDLKTLRIHSVRLPGETRDYVISPGTGHVFCFRLIDSDIAP